MTDEAREPTIEELLAFARQRRRTIATLRDVHARLGQEIAAGERDIAAAEAQAARRSAAVVEARHAARAAGEAHPSAAEARS